ncbi:cytochrome b [Marinibactrum halimedae]|uniref:Cytochrome b561 n=1 Tax=Marinibactrum halimedae TaxID=1444977 RepID=A0AA37T0Y5_9GAMM|nr:cytochrome b/b6 domain-containing protein [Marinibactrum halimedae]MCD9457651.1 cytochrome b/b6 domain-containing protein [Marinibactrum halimedae]GLS24975.1 cytochrome b561 [Marinibactrum halimedae]
MHTYSYDAKSRSIHRAPALRVHGYSFMAKLFHWVSAIVILWATVSGLSLSFIQSEQIVHAIAAFNVSITTVLIPVFILRIVYRLSHSPSENYQLSAHERFVAHIAHVVLYLVTAVVLLSGVLMMDEPITLFHLYQLPLNALPGHYTDAFSGLHKYSCRSLAILILVHLLAVVHHEVSGKRVLSRMI